MRETQIEGEARKEKTRRQCQMDEEYRQANQDTVPCRVHGTLIFSSDRTAVLFPAELSKCADLLFPLLLRLGRIGLRLVAGRVVSAPCLAVAIRLGRIGAGLIIGRIGGGALTLLQRVFVRDVAGRVVCAARLAIAIRLGRAEITLR